jgi:hypothetical protein
MSNQMDNPQLPRSARSKEYQDPHFHDDDLYLPPPDDIPRQGNRPRHVRKPARLVPQRRRHYED